MFEEIEQRKLSTLGLIISPFLLIIGFIGRTQRWPIAWLWLVVFSSAALIVQFGPEAYRRLLKPIRKGSWKAILIFVILSMFLSLAAAKFGSFLFQSPEAENPVAQIIINSDFLGKVYFFLTTWISLAGEELITAAIALPVYYYLAKKLEGNHAFILSSIISALFFGMLHLHTYSWNWYQCLVVIGLTRIPFNYAWKKADSLWGGIICHTIYDYLLFLILLLNHVLSGIG